MRINNREKRERVNLFVMRGVPDLVIAGERLLGGGVTTT